MKDYNIIACKRFLARKIDIWVSRSILIIPLVKILLYTAGANLINDIYISSILAIFIMNGAIWVLIEPIFLSFFGTTLGKLIFRIRVLDKTGEKLTYGSALIRSFNVWLKGMALGIPFLQSLANIKGYSDLTIYGATSWDSKDNNTVTYQPISEIRFIFIVFFIPLIFFLPNLIIDLALPSGNHSMASKNLLPAFSPTIHTRIEDDLKIVDQRLAEAGLHWGTTLQDNDLQICRSFYNGGFHVGHYYQNHCHLSYGGTAFISSNSQILLGNPKHTEWDPLLNGIINKNSLMTGIEPLPSLSNRQLFSCRVTYNHEVHIGKLVDKVCDIAVGNKEIYIQENIEVLARKSNKK